MNVNVTRRYIKKDYFESSNGGYFNSTIRNGGSTHSPVTIAEDSVSNLEIDENQRLKMLPIRPVTYALMQFISGFNPSNPEIGTQYLYMRSYGTSPSKVTILASKNELGEEIIHNSLIN